MVGLALWEQCTLLLWVVAVLWEDLELATSVVLGSDVLLWEELVETGLWEECILQL